MNLERNEAWKMIVKCENLYNSEIVVTLYSLITLFIFFVVVFLKKLKSIFGKKKTILYILVNLKFLLPKNFNIKKAYEKMGTN